MSISTSSALHNSFASEGILECNAEQAIEFNKAAKGRLYRQQIEILIVEDQPFSAKLLLKLLEHEHKPYTAPDAEQAWEIYLTYAPDIVFLDIELPGINGHQLAAAICKIDPRAFVVMVTANNLMKDVTYAKENNAKGFIIKPYNKQKIFESVQKFIKMK